MFESFKKLYAHLYIIINIVDTYYTILNRCAHIEALGAPIYVTVS